MSPQPPASRASLERQLRALRRQLAESEQQRLESEQRRAEAEETLEAIRTGQVDALVVGGPAGDQVYTLQGADRSYRLLVETVNAGAATLGPDGVILYANRQLARMLGVSLETLMGTPLDRFVAPDDRAIFRRLVEEAQTVASAGELRFLTDAEQGLPVQVALRLLDTPELRAVCLIATDLTERKHAEESLRQAKDELEQRVQERTAALDTQRALLQTILEQAADGITVRDAEGRLIFVNAAATRMAAGKAALGTPLEAAPSIWGETFDRAGNPLTVEQWPISRALRGETVTGAEWQRVAPDGSQLVVLNSAAPLRDPAGAIMGAVAITTDITERTRAEHQLREALADKETLIKEAHHRTKNNLQMLCSLLELQAAAIESPEGKAALEESAQRIYSIARLYEQLYRSMSSGQVRLCDYLRALAENFRKTYSIPEIKYCMPSDPGVFIDVDRAIPCGLIVNELLTNAVKHAFPDGRLGDIGISVRDAGDRVEMQVWDGGRGFPADLKVEQASSLGLRLVNLLARRLQAEIHVNVSRGTAFTLAFPTVTEA